MLTLTVLGCDGSHADAGGAASGYLVRSWESGTSVWMDAGPGTFANLQRFTDPLALSAIVLTHEHNDHFSDIDGFITVARWVYEFARDPVPVYAAPGVRAHLTQDIGGILDWHEVGDGDGADVGDLRLAFRRTDHPPVTLATRCRRPVGGAGVLCRLRAGVVVLHPRPRPRPRPVRGHVHLRAQRAARAHERRRSRVQRPARRGSSPGGHPPVATVDARDVVAEAVRGLRGPRGAGRRGPGVLAVTDPRARRADGRDVADLRPVSFVRDFTEFANGSVLVSMGKTKVLCTASVEERVPPLDARDGKGWVTAEYSLLPGSSAERVGREAAKGQAVGADPRDPAPDRPVAAGGDRPRRPWASVR